jgi:hypothetical protein
MRIFNDNKTAELTNPDLSKGYLKQDKLFIAHHEAQEEIQQQSHYEVIAEYPNGGKDLKEVIDVEYRPAKDAWEEYKDILVYIPYTQEQLNENLNKKYIPSEQASLAAVGRMFLKTAQVEDTETKMAVSGLFETWTAGKYEVGDLCNYAGQTYECTQAHDNATYPDITPENPQTWANFWKPLHGKSATNARPWVKPQFGTTDMYLTGEFMVYTDGKVYKCLSDTAYSPEEYALSWEIQN